MPLKDAALAPRLERPHERLELLLELVVVDDLPKGRRDAAVRVGCPKPRERGDQEREILLDALGRLRRVRAHHARRRRCARRVRPAHWRRHVVGRLRRRHPVECASRRGLAAKRRGATRRLGDGDE